MTRWVALVAVFGVFVVGVAVGVLGTHLFYAREIGRVGGGAFGAHRFVEWLERELNLTEDQQRRIDAILEQSRREADALHREMLPTVRAQMERTAEQIRELLTPEQQETFDELQRRHRRRAEHFFLGGGGRRPHGPPRFHERPPEHSPEPPPNE